MKRPRYLLDYSDITFEKVFSDFLIIGTGIAGLYSAIHARDYGNVRIVTKEKLEDSNTEHAQGGIAAVFDKEDSTELHSEDTLTAGAGLCNRPAVDVLVNEGPKRVMELIKLGAQFDKDHNEIALTREGAHSRRRVLHAGGDATGEEVRRALTTVAVNRLGIPIHEKTFILDLIIHEGRCYGALAYCHHYKKFVAYLAPYTVIASGGCGQLYQTTSNPEVATGDGMAFAYRGGAELMDMEFIQFHPTTLYLPQGSGFLISEAVRGEGAVLRNAAGERFMSDYHPLEELAPRDVVARAIVDQMRKDGKEHVWLDFTEKDGDFVKKRFPTIYKNCLEHGFDLAEDWIPVTPAAHYMMGGIRTSLDAATRVPGLFACGETACNGVHGANRLASNSLLDGLVFGHRIVDKVGPEIKKFKEDLDTIPLFTPESKAQRRNGLPVDLRNQLQQLMSEHVGIIRSEESLKKALQQIEDWSRYLEGSYTTMEDWETQNMLLIASVMVKSALTRKESRGAHFRSDYPEPIDSYKGRHFTFRETETGGDTVEMES